MRGVTFGERKLQLAEFPDPAPGPREVIVEIKASGMCGSDLKFYRATGGASSLGLGKVSGPVIAGHEPCGIVAAVGPEVRERTACIGARGHGASLYRLRCVPHCLTGWSQMCVEGSIVYGVTGNGAHAPYMKVPAHTLVSPSAVKVSSSRQFSWQRLAGPWLALNALVESPTRRRADHEDCESHKVGGHERQGDCEKSHRSASKVGDTPVGGEADRSADFPPTAQVRGPEA
jgi:NADPH:quinone reductase-like Zn-dependent oxidoreductase